MTGRDTPRRSLAKTLSWRAIATAVTASLTYVFTGSWELGVTVGGADTLLKLGLYFAHERAWARVPVMGPTAAAPAPAPPE